jgi:hypothetical protein
MRTMGDTYERYLADLASADGMPEAPADPEVLQPPEAQAGPAEV